jgi:hypothetical protein
MGREERTGMFDMPENPSLTDLFRINNRKLKVTIRTATVGAIAVSDQQPTGYDTATQLCSVLVQQLTTIVNPDVQQGAGSTILQPPVLLVDVPVAWPRTAQGYLTFPLTIGDTGELIVQDRSLAEWRKKGIPVDPIDNWTHNRGDAVFHPGLHADTNPIVPPTDLTGTVIDGTLVKLGRLSVDFAIKGTSLAAQLVPLIATLSAVPNATDPASVIVLANANKAALLAFMNLIQPNLTTKAQVE